MLFQGWVTPHPSHQIHCIQNIKGEFDEPPSPQGEGTLLIGAVKMTLLFPQ